MLLSLLAGAPIALPAHPAATHGGEQQVNTVTAGPQQQPAVAMAPDGRFFAVWVRNGDAIVGQRFDRDGLALGDEISIDDFAESGTVAHPAIAMDELGNFVVVWQSDGSPGTDDSLRSIQARRFATNGTPAGGQFQVNVYTLDNQELPAVAMASDGDFVVAWQSVGSAGTDDDASSIQARRYDQDGVSQGGQFQVNGSIGGDQARPAISMTSDGRFVVAWMSSESAGDDDDGFSVQARRYAANAVAEGGEIQLNTLTGGDQILPAVAVGPQGDFVAAWANADASGDDADGFGIRARRFDADGDALGAELEANAVVAGDQGFPDVARDAGGDFTVVWTSPSSAAGDDDAGSIQGRQFRGDGTAAGPQFQVNTTAAGEQSEPALAMDANGNFFVVWTSASSAGSDDDDKSVQGQLYDEIFRDGFEAGNAGRWQ